MNEIIVNQNYWKIPKVENAFSGWLEGCPTEDEKLQVIAKTLKDRKNWKPNAEAMALVKILKEFVGFQVKIQFWDNSLFWSNEDPYFITGDLKGVIIINDEGFQQAYLELDSVSEECDFYLRKRSESIYHLASFADLYIISII